MEISGVILSGIGKGAYFTTIDWVVQQCREMLGFTPFPGTLNVRVHDMECDKLDRLCRETTLRLVPDNPAFCSAPIQQVTVWGLPAAIVFPAEEVRVHEHRIIEIISSQNLKQTLGLKDGDPLTLVSHHMTR